MAGQPLFILDVDGVLLDSVDETSLIAYITAAGRDVEGREKLPPGYLRRMRANRCHVKHAAHFVRLARWALGEPPPEKEFLSMGEGEKLVEMPHDEARELEASFFAARTRWSTAHRTEWLHLNKPFHPAWEAVCRFRGLLVALTTKNRKATLEIAGSYGWNVAPEDIYSGDNRTTKEENLRQIMRRFPERDAFFIDDVVQNLLDVRGAWTSGGKLTALLASWGYLCAEHFNQAQAEGIEAINQGEFAALLDSWSDRQAEARQGQS